jgi:histidine triad (HIT) family protein
MDCLFCKIIKRDIPAEIVYEDKDNIAFLDIGPVNKGHTLVVPKKHSENILDISDADLKKLVSAAQKVTKAVVKAVNADGVNVSMNNKRAAGQLVFHTHFHIIPRFESDGFKHWPHSKYNEGEAKLVAEKIKKML